MAKIVTHLSDPKEVIEKLGRDWLKDSLGIKEGAIFNALKRGKLPSRWFASVEGGLAEHGYTVDRSVFTFGDTAKEAAQ